MGAAHALSQAGIPSVVLEKSRSVSGRAATRQHGAVRFDHGANFFRLEDDIIRRLVTEQLPADDLVEIHGPVWTFDASGRISEGDPAHNESAKWTYRDGVSRLGKLLRTASELSSVHLECLVVRVERRPEGWLAHDEAGGAHGPFPEMLLTLPAPQAAALLEASALHPGAAATLAGTAYHPQFSFVMGWPQRLSRPGPFHALVNLDRGHAIAWLSFEEDKPGHVPEGEGVMVVQMSPAWTADRFKYPPVSLLPEVVEQAGGLLEGDVPEPAWWNSQRWRYAHPVAAVKKKTLANLEEDALFYAGDAVAGKGRVPLALKAGIEAARRILARRAG